MNLKEGTRRLALLLGLVGLILGGFAGYSELQTTLAQKARHNQFDRLANSEGVQHLRREHLESKDRWESNVKSVMPGCCGIKEVTWDIDHVWKDATGIYSIETDEGQFFFPTTAPGPWTYLLIALLPIIGFFIPWGAVRAIGWVGSGFFQPAK